MMMVPIGVERIPLRILTAIITRNYKRWRDIRGINHN
jgi:hypothetical protein